MSKPIDPTDVLALERVANTALTGWVRLHDMKRINTETLTALQTVIPAVARAVLPEGYVAVPVAEIQGMVVDITESPWWDSAEDAGETLYAVRDRLNSLIPTEATDDTD